MERDAIAESNQQSPGKEWSRSWHHLKLQCTMLDGPLSILNHFKLCTIFHLQSPLNLYVLGVTAIQRWHTASTESCLHCCIWGRRNMFNLVFRVWHRPTCMEGTEKTWGSQSDVATVYDLFCPWCHSAQLILPSHQCKYCNRDIHSFNGPELFPGCTPPTLQSDPVSAGRGSSISLIFSTFKTSLKTWFEGVGCWRISFFLVTFSTYYVFIHVIFQQNSLVLLEDSSC